MKKEVSRSPGIVGKITVPSDKSIAHRTAIFAAIANGTSRLVHFPTAADPQSTLSVLRQLGVETREVDEGIIDVIGCGPRGFKKPLLPLDCGNSGTTMRLIAGVLAGQDFRSELVGDASLSKRPMDRIAEPLRLMGADIQLTDGHAPVVINGGRTLSPIQYDLPVASAQVKSCVLLAGLFCTDPTTVSETIPSRDHTERMLGLDSLTLGDARIVSSSSRNVPVARTYSIPRDFSAAAFFVVAATIIEGSMLVMNHVGLNPSRSKMLEILDAMGGAVIVVNEREFGQERIGDVYVKPSDLHGIVVPEEWIPSAVDEIPILCVAATQASGTTVIRGAGELRHKESDRIRAMVDALSAMGADIDEHDDGLTIRGGNPLKGCEVDSLGDHRVAMALAIAGLCAEGTTTIANAECAEISFPEFWNELEKVSV